MVSYATYTAVVNHVHSLTFRTVRPVSTSLTPSRRSRCCSPLSGLALPIPWTLSYQEREDRELGGQYKSCGHGANFWCTVVRPRGLNAPEVTVFTITLSTSSLILGRSYLSLHFLLELKAFFESQLVWQGCWQPAKFLQPCSAWIISPVPSDHSVTTWPGSCATLCLTQAPFVLRVLLLCMDIDQTLPIPTPTGFYFDFATP